MGYTLRKWWILKRLYKSCSDHSLGVHTQITLSGGGVADYAEGFIDWIKLWRFYWTDKNQERIGKKKIYYGDIIRDCIREELIEILKNPHDPTDRRDYIRPTSQGTKFYKTFWFNRIKDFITNPITVIIIGAIATGLVSMSIANTLRPTQGEIYKVQIIPYENGTIIQQR